MTATSTELLDFEIAGFDGLRSQTVANTHSVIDNTTAVKGTILDHERVAGSWSVVLEHADRSVHMGNLRVEQRRTVNGRGIGTVFVAEVERVLAGSGFEAIHLHAVTGNELNGAYFWARLHYDWSSYYCQARVGRAIASVDPDSSLARRLIDGDDAATPRVVSDDPVGHDVLLGAYLEFDDCLSWFATKDLRTRVHP